MFVRSFQALSSLQKTFFLSLFLHGVLFLLGAMPAGFWGIRCSHPTPHVMHSVMVDFVRVGPKSTAPMLGPRTVQNSAIKRKDPAVLKKQNQASAAQANKQNKQKEVSSLKIDSIPSIKSPVKQQDVKKNVKASVPSDVEESVKKKEQKKEKAKTKVQDLSKKQKASNAKVAQKQNSKQPSTVKAKVDLSKKGMAVQTVSDFLSKKQAVQARSTELKDSAVADTLGEELTGTDIDLLNQHMKSFWNLPSGHEKAYGISVEVELFIAKDGTITKAEVVDQARLQKDPEFRIAAESALRSVLDPECSPLPLDPKKYKAWKHMIFVFDPSEMCR